MFCACISSINKESNAAKSKFRLMKCVFVDRFANLIKIPHVRVFGIEIA
jgi:hypothetical protein